MPFSKDLALLGCFRPFLGFSFEGPGRRRFRTFFGNNDVFITDLLDDVFLGPSPSNSVANRPKGDHPKVTFLTVLDRKSGQFDVIDFDVFYC